MRLKTAFEWAETGPNAGEKVTMKRHPWPPGKLKRSDYDGPEMGDPTKLMPHLRAIHKLGSVEKDSDYFERAGKWVQRKGYPWMFNRATEATHNPGAYSAVKGVVSGLQKKDPLRAASGIGQAVLGSRTGGKAVQAVGKGVKKGVQQAREALMPVPGILKPAEFSKAAGISASEVGVEDLDALKTTGRHYARQAQRVFSNKPTDTGPGYEADHDSKSTADGGNEPESTGDWPIEDPQEGEGTKALFRKHMKGFQKRAAGVLDLMGSVGPDARAVLSDEMRPDLPRLDTMAQQLQQELLNQAVYEARMRGGEMRGSREPAAMAMAGRKAMEGAQYARLADADVDAINARLAKQGSWEPWLKSEKLSGRIKVAAKLKTKLLPHQERVVERIKKQPGLVVAHGLGSGKTLSSIAAAVRLEPDRTQVLVPASLRANYQKELDKHVSGELPPIEVGSLQGAAAKGLVPKADLLVVDEAHRGRNPQSKTYQMIEGAKANKRLLLTASPTYNRPSDVASLVNMAAGDRIMPMGVAFDKQYIAQPRKGVWGLLPFTRKQEGLKRKKELKKVLSQWVDYHKSGGKGFPDVEEERHAVKMSKRQTQLHDAAWNQLSLISKMRLRRGLPPDKQDLSKINNFQSQTRQISSTESPYAKGKSKVEISPKVQKAVGLLAEATSKNPEQRSLVYSNYLGTLRDYSKQLEKKKIPHAIFSGKVKMRDRKQMVQDYNKGKLKALLVSSAGGEGLDLKGTRLVQVLEPHWNVEKLKQVEGRAIRRGSHTHLPKKEQNVTLQRFESYPRGGIFRKRKGVEQVLGDMATNKERLNQELLGLMEKKAEKPYRERVEVFARTPGGKILAGEYPGDRSIGTFGGGIDAGEDVLQAGRREFQEESGRLVRNIRPVKIEPFAAPFPPSEQKTPKQKRRAKTFGGSRTQYLTGDLGPRSKTKSHETGTYLKNIKLRPIGDAIAQQQEAMANAEGTDRQRIGHRLKVLEELSKNRLAKFAFAMPAVENTGYQKKIRRRFGKLETALERHGDPLGTGHKRILIPKRVMKEDDLVGQLGFVPVKVAIPEMGQSRFESFRHPHNLFHLHEHGDAWVMHKDDHPASTMLVKKWRMAREAIKNTKGKSQKEIKKALKATGGRFKPVGDFIRGLPHVITEGLPGAYYYAKGKVTRGKGMRERLEEATPAVYKRQIKRWKELGKTAEYAALGSLV